MLQKIKESAAFIANCSPVKPLAGIILGTGLGAFAGEIDMIREIPFSEIPHFPVSGVEGHNGALLLGHLKSIPLIVLQGRIHYYEGFTMEQITFPVRVMKFLGIKQLLLSNAAGGLNPAFRVGDLMVVMDHINLMPNPLIGTNDENLGPRFPDMDQAYDAELVSIALSIAKRDGIQLQQGVYVGVSGPTYETLAEYKFFRLIGGDAVGMSTVPEVIVARHMGIRCIAISVITNLGLPEHHEPHTYYKIQQAAIKAEPRMAAIFKGLLQQV